MSTPAIAPDRLKKERQLIGIARRALGIDPDTHAAIVRRVTAGRTATTTACTLSELLQIKGEYQRAGWQATPRNNAPRPLRPGQSRPAAAAALTGTGPLLGKIAALLADQRLPWSYALGIYRQQRGLPRDATLLTPLELASAQELRAIVAALAKRQSRQTPDRAPLPAPAPHPTPTPEAPRHDRP